MSAANRELFFLQPLNFATFFQEKVEEPAAGVKKKCFKKYFYNKLNIYINVSHMPLVEDQTAAFRFQKMATLNIYFNVSQMPLVEAQTEATNRRWSGDQTKAFRLYLQPKKNQYNILTLIVSFTPRNKSMALLLKLLSTSNTT
jgi:hypothetical protein